VGVGVPVGVGVGVLVGVGDAVNVGVGVLVAMQSGPPTRMVNPASEPPPVLTKTVAASSADGILRLKTIVIVSGRSLSCRPSTLTVPGGVPCGSISIFGVAPFAAVADALNMSESSQQPLMRMWLISCPGPGFEPLTVQT
jgi:hypothetical protein